MKADILVFFILRLTYLVFEFLKYQLNCIEIKSFHKIHCYETLNLYMQWIIGYPMSWSRTIDWQ